MTTASCSFARASRSLASWSAVRFLSCVSRAMSRCILTSRRQKTIIPISKPTMAIAAAIFKRFGHRFDRRGAIGSGTTFAEASVCGVRVSVRAAARIRPRSSSHGAAGVETYASKPVASRHSMSAARHSAHDARCASSERASAASSASSACKASDS